MNPDKSRLRARHVRAGAGKKLTGTRGTLYGALLPIISQWRASDDVARRSKPFSGAWLGITFRPPHR